MFLRARERIPPCLRPFRPPLGGLVGDVLGAAVPLGAVGVLGTPVFGARPPAGAASGAPGGFSNDLPAPVPGTGGASRLSPGAPKPTGFGAFSVVS